MSGDGDFCIREDFQSHEVSFIKCDLVPVLPESAQKVDSCVNMLKAVHFCTLYQTQYVWFYVEVFGPLGFEFYTECYI